MRGAATPEDALQGPLGLHYPSRIIAHALMSTTRSKKICAVTALVTLTTLSSSRAQAEVHDAAGRRAAYVEARSAILAKDWVRARKILQELWSEAQSYDVALGLGQAELNLKQYPPAAEHLTYALENLPPHESAELRKRAEEFLAAARTHLATVRVWVQPDGANVMVDGQLVGKAPLSSDIFVEIGPHSISAHELSYEPVEVRIDAIQGQSYPVSLQLSPLAAQPSPATAAATLTSEPAPTAVASAPPPEVASPPAPSAPAADRPVFRPNPLPAYLATGVAVIGASVAVGAFVAASNKESDKDALLASITTKPACGQGTPYVDQCNRVKELNDDARTLRVVGYVGVGVAGLAAGTATYLFVRRPRAAEQSALRLRVVPTLAPRSAGALLSTAF